MANTINGTSGADKITVTESDITVNAGLGDDRITVAGGSRNVVHGNAGNDTIVAASGAGTENTVYGDEGDDSINAKGSSNSITGYGGSGTDTVYGSAGPDTLYGGEGSDTLYGQEGNDHIYGDEGEDKLYGNAGNDRLYGGAGNDTLYGQEGNDTLTGGAGKDTFVHYASYENDTITDYTAGEDTILTGVIAKTELSNDGKDVKYSIGDGSITVANGAGKVISMEDYRGTYTASDTRIALGADFAGTMDAEMYLPTVTNIAGSSVATGAVLKGNGNDNVMSGGAGNDTLYGRAGNDTLYGQAGDDTLYGGAGDDMLYGGAGADYINGEAGNDRLYGNEGDDRLYGGEGDDTLYGQGGNDTLAGGSGKDTFVQNASGYGHNTITDYTAGSDTIEVAGGAISKTEFANDGKAVKYTIGDGSITVQNGAGKTVGIKDSRGSYTASDTRIALGADFTGEMDSGKYLSTVTNIVGSSVATGATLKGNGNDNVISAGAGSDTLYGGEGSDTLYGQDGDDYVYGDAGDDKLYGNAGNDRLYGGAGNDTLCGQEGNDTLTGGAGKDTFVHYASYENDTITDYTAGEDTILTGVIAKTELSNDGKDVKYTIGDGSVTVANGAGKVISMEDYRGSYTASDTRIALGADFTGTMDASKYLPSVTNIAGSSVTTGAVLKGNGNDNVMSGGAGDDTLYGGAGDDTLYGQAGADYINGEAGNDRLYGNAGDDRLYGGEGDDTLYGQGGNDTLAGGSGKDTFVQNASGYGHNTITDYTAGSDTIEVASGAISKTEFANDGKDVKYTIGDGSITVQNGVGKAVGIKDSRGSYTASDTRIALGADFTGEMDSGKYLPTVTNIAGGNVATGATLKGNGNDNVISAGAGSDTLYGGEGSDTLYGQDGDDYVYGDAGDDKLYGNAGNDHLYGGAGNDTLAGGEGSDTVVYSDGDGSDTVADYAAGEDTLKIADGSISKTELNGNDVTFTVGSGSVTVKSGKNKVISLEDSRGSYTVSDTRIALNKGFTGEMDAGKYLSTVTNIAGSGATTAVTLRGNVNDNVMSGGAKTDTLYGGEGADKLYGYGGNDVLYGQQGNDYLYGGAGTDKLYGGSGDDAIYGEAGNDTLDGYTGNDTLTGGAGNDTLSGGAGNDTFVYANGDGSDTVTDYAAGEDTIKIASGSISKTDLGSNGTDVKFTVGSGSVLVKNGKGKIISLEDSRGSYTVSDTRIAVGKDFTGEMDASKYLSTVTNIAGSGATAAVTLRGNANNNVMSGGAKADTLYGGEGADKLYGYGGNDVLYGQQGNDYLYGGDGADKLYGGSGNDKIYGEAGNDVLDGYTGNDTLTGGEGSDTFVYSNGDGSDTISDYTAKEDTIKIASGSISKTEIASNGTDVTFTVGDGSVTVQNGKGKVISLEDSRGSYTASDTRIALGADFTGEMDSGKYLSTVTNIAGSGATAAVTLLGNTNNNAMSGGAGDDTLYGGAGKDTLYGGSGDDAVYGDAGNDKLYGNSGDDHLYGGAGDDTLYGQAGDDTLEGGAGKDTFVHYESYGNDTIADYAAGYDTVKIVSSTVDKAELINNDKDILYTIGNSTVTVENGAGKTISLKDSRGSYTMSGTTVTLGSDFSGTLESEAYLSTLTKIDGRNTEKAVKLEGNDHNNTMNGGSAADTLYAGAGDDTLYGRAGNDYLYGDAGNDKLYGGSGDDRLEGGSGDDTLHGGAGKDTFVHLESYGNDTILDYAAGYDTINILSSTVDKADLINNDNDIQYTIGNSTVTVENGAGKTVSLKDSRGSYTMSGTTVTLGSDFSGTLESEAYLSTLTKIDGRNAEKAVTLKGNDQNNTIYGGSRADVLEGGSGDDYLYGQAGFDTLHGGSGNDVLYGGAGDYDDCSDDILYGDTGDDKLYGQSGNDTLNGGSGNDTLYGDDDDNHGRAYHSDVLYGGDGDDELYGGYGNDTLYGDDGDDVLNGGHDYAKLVGGSGRDTFVYYAGDGGYHWIDDYTVGDDTIEIAGTTFSGCELDDRDKNVKFTVGDGSITVKDGSEKIISLKDNRGSYTVSGSNIMLGSDFVGEMDLKTGFWINGSSLTKPLTIKGQYVIGGSGSDTLTAYNRWSELYGGVGDDILYGGGSLNGGAGNDTLNGDASNDTLNGDAGNDVLNGDAGDDVLNGGDGNDTLNGGSGDDVLNGDAGNDTLNGGDGNDTLTGGAGNDTFVVRGGDYDTITDYTTGEDIIALSTDTNGYHDKYVSGAALINDGKDIEFNLKHINIETGSYDYALGRVTVQNGVGKEIAFAGDYYGGLSLTLSDQKIILGQGFTRGGLSASDFWDTLTEIDGSLTANSIKIYGNGNDNIIRGGAGDDTLEGYAGNNELNGGAGDDVLNGDSGDDTLNGGSGNDTLNGFDGNNELNGGDGNDELNGGYDNDTLNGGLGNDTLNGREGDDVLNGGDGNDELYGFFGNDTLNGGAGNDCLRGGFGNDELHGGAGDDVLYGIQDYSHIGTYDYYTISIGDEDEIKVLYGDAGNDILYGGDGDDILNGGTGNDTLIGRLGNDILTGGAGNDTFVVDNGDTITDYTTGEDIIELTPGHDGQYYGAVKGAELINGGNDIKFSLGVPRDNYAYLYETGSVTVQNGIGKEIAFVGDYRGGLTISDQKIVLGQGFTGESIYAQDFLDTLIEIDGSRAANSIEIWGNGNDNIIYGGSGNDSLDGYDGNDVLYGGYGDDYLYGGYGNDTLYGGSGNDELSGGHGKDVYVFDRFSTGNSIIYYDEFEGLYSDEYSVLKFNDNVDIASYQFVEDSSWWTSVLLRLTTGGTIKLDGAAHKSIVCDYGDGNLVEKSFPG